MKKLWRYISLKSNYVLSTKQVITAATVAIGLFHVFLMILFTNYEIYPLIFVNVVSIVTYIAAFSMIVNGVNLLYVFNTIYMEILIHSVIAAAIMGPDSGFTLYLIAIIPFGYYASYSFRSDEKKINPMVYLILAILGFCITRVINTYVEPICSYGNERVDETIYMINYFVAIVAVIGFFSTLLNQIIKLEAKQLKQNHALEVIAKIDPLTGLANRRSIEERYKKAEENGERYAVVLGDIDDFKKVNDTYGHDVGDEVLKRVAAVFKEVVRENDVVCRWGGEEIVVFLSGNTKEEARFVAERILDRIRLIEMEVEDAAPFKITMTLGVSDTEEETGFDSIVKKADEKLYKGKVEGKNKVVYN